ncbi:MAG TPA: efflux RND transporter periplasmic adaptor subunit [Gammaproteobacteria bacterium]|nr:efflux RND transporter periplasmic adaptor subunit [Gammaproteobacteria bacterium]
MDLKSTVLLLLASVAFTTACEQPEPPVVVTSRPVKTIVVDDGSLKDTRSFPAVVDAIQKADISFRVSGKIIKIHVREGDLVKKDQVLAELDPTDFTITLKDRKASFQTAKANFDRAASLVDKGAISRADYDEIRAKYYSARSSLEEAEQNLRYTRLRANFDGLIARRHVENFEEIHTSQTIFSLEDVSALKIKIDVPENIMIATTRERRYRFYALFDSIPGQRFPLTFLESTTKADPKTKTFKVTLKMDAPKDYNILPGMTTTVYATAIAGGQQAPLYVTLPASAVVSSNDKQATVWVVDENTMTVHPKAVKTGLLKDSRIQVEGLSPGDRVVVAGAAFLRDGMKVTLLETGDQAQ